MLYLCLVTKKLWKSAVCAVGDYYFELADCVVDHYSGKYFTVTNKDILEQLGSKDLMLVQNSERVWCEEGAGVRYVKHRYGNMFAPVDLKEFMWIKLKAKEIK